MGWNSFHRYPAFNISFRSPTPPFRAPLRTVAVANKHLYDASITDTVQMQGAVSATIHALPAVAYLFHNLNTLFYSGATVLSGVLRAPSVWRRNLTFSLCICFICNEQQRILRRRHSFRRLIRWWVGRLRGTPPTTSRRGGPVRCASPETWVERNRTSLSFCSCAAS